MKNGYKEIILDLIKIKNHKDVWEIKDGIQLEQFYLLLDMNYQKMFNVYKLNLIKLIQLQNTVDLQNFQNKDMLILIVEQHSHVEVIQILLVKMDKLDQMILQEEQEEVEIKMLILKVILEVKDFLWMMSKEKKQ